MHTGCSSLRGRKRLPLCCIKLDTATDLAEGCGATFARQGQQFRGTAFSVRSLLQNSQTVNRA